MKFCLGESEGAAEGRGLGEEFRVGIFFEKSSPRKNLFHKFNGVKILFKTDSNPSPAVFLRKGYDRKEFNAWIINAQQS